MTQQGQGDVGRRDIVLRLEDIADASLREDGTDIPLGEQLREAAREITRLRALLSPSRGEQGINAAEIAQNVAVRVAGLSDRTSPDDWPEAMLVTSEELHLIVMSEIHEALYDAKSAPGSVPTSLAGQVPDGYVIVPKKPSEEMLRSISAACRNFYDEGGPYPRSKAVYKAILSVAPQPTAGGDARSCTCHPDDNPPSPCPRKYALSECRSADLVRRIRIVLDNNEPLAGYSCKHGIDASLCPMIDCPTPYDRDVILKDVLDLLSVYQAVPTSLAGQVPDGYVLVPKEPTEEMLAQVEPALDDYYNGNKSESYEEGGRQVYKAMLAVAPQPLAPAGQGTDTCTCDEFQSCPRCHTANLDPDWLEKELAEVAPQPTAGGDAPTIARGNFPDDEPECCPRCGNAWERPDPFALANGIDRAIKKAVSAERARVIEECAKIAETFDAYTSSVPGQYVQGNENAKRGIAAALRALGQQDTGGADHG